MIGTRSKKLDTVILSIGTNLGDRKKNIKEAVSLLEEEISVKTKKSNVYDTPPLYYDGPERFYNCCVSFHTRIEPGEILRITQKIETKMGRKVKGDNNPRVIDLDIIFIGDRIIAEADFTVPHPGMQDRLFVLRPLSEIHDSFQHPVLGVDVGTLTKECPDMSTIDLVKNFWD
ncbi:2-amino-4-hydroxy-6-hydroxymethyldihydropteridine diphosphokinase [Elusimicrobiota bacterium]